MKRTLILGLALISVLAIFSLPFAASAQKGSGFDYYLQDDSGCPVLKWNSKTGQYIYSDGDLVLAGIAKTRGTRILFKNGAYAAQYTIDVSTRTAVGFCFDNTENEIEGVINDSNYMDNTGSCPAPAQ